MKPSSRRDLLRLASAGALGVGLSRAADPSVAGMKFEAKDTVRLGVIGIGGRGDSLIENFSAIPQVRVTAICDTVKDKVTRQQAKLERAGKQPPALYHSSDHAFEDLVKRDDIDLVVIATPWNWHAPMALAGMKHGKHVAVEVPAARTIEECWDLVNTSESTRRHCIQLENCCYGYNELLVLNMVRAGLFGDLTHGAAAYNHDLRSVLFSNEGEGLWRRFENVSRNGNLYPTHGLGPVAHYMDINRGDRFEYLVSMSSPAFSLAAYRKEHLRPDDPRQKEVYRCGDLNVEPDPDGQGPRDHSRAQRLHSAALRPHQPDRRHQGHLPRLSAAHLRGRRRQGGSSDRSTPTKRSSSIPTGRRWASWRASWAATAAWIS